MKIAFVGTSCTGKTSLVEACKQQIPNVVIVEEADRMWLQLHTEVTDRFGFAAQASVQQLAIQLEQAAEVGGGKLIICDRSVLDPAAYLFGLGDRAGAEKLYEIARPLIAHYDKIFLLDPRDVPYKTDEIRTEDEATRQLFHAGFVQFFELYQVPYELLSGNHASRLRQVKTVLAK